MSSLIHLDLHTHHAVLNFGSENHNALSSSLLEKMISAIQSLDQRDIKCILLQSTGDRTFCAGADLKELKSLASEAEAKHFFYQVARLLLAIRQSPHIIIVKVQGKAVGGAVGLIAAADYVIASDQASIRLSELSNGIGPFVIGPALEKKIGLAAFQHLSLRPALWHTSAWSSSNHLYNEVYAGPADVENAITVKMEELNNYSKYALRALKEMTWASTAFWEPLLDERAGISGKLLMTAEAQSALAKL